MQQVLHVLTGCTAVGKTEVALRWAEAHGAEIISCDSLLFYRGADLGTAKPSAAERARVRHHLIDVCAPDEPMDITGYVARVRAVLADLAARARRVVVTGGSGFYLKAFFGPVADDVVVPPAVRAAVRAQIVAEGPEGLVEELRRMNPAGLGTLDVRNPRRVARAVERCRATGRTLADLQAAFAAQPPPFAGWEPRLVELTRPAEELAARIAGRTRAMVAAGLLEETRALVARGARGNPSVGRAIGYREALAVLDGMAPASGLEAAITRSTLALVKKQRTWFRTQLPAHRSVAAAEGAEAALFGQG